MKKVFLEISQKSPENNCIRVSFLIKLQAQGCNFIKKETLAQIFFREVWVLFKNTFLIYLIYLFDNTFLVTPGGDCFLNFRNSIELLRKFHTYRNVSFSDNFAYLLNE